MPNPKISCLDRKGGGLRVFVENGTNNDHIRTCFVYGGGVLPGRRTGSGVGSKTSPYFWEVSQTCKFKNKMTDPREFNQNTCRGFGKDKIKNCKSFCTSLIKKRAFFSPEPACLCNLTGFTRLSTWAQQRRRRSALPI